MNKKIVITGPESTGKTTLARALAEHYKTVFLPEFAREYLEKNGPEYTFDDVVCMAKKQREKEVAFKCETMILDSNLLTYKIWFDEKFDKQIDWIEDELVKDKNSIYILSYIDFPWEFDPLRENPDYNDRLRLLKKHINFFEQNDSTFIVVSGSIQDRIKKSIEFIDQQK